MKRRKKMRSTKEEEEEKEKKKMPILPDELLIEILLRLPVKSLLRLRCVSKSCLSHISDPQFARSHFDLAAAAARTHRLVILDSSSPDIRSIDLDASSLHDLSAPIHRGFLAPAHVEIVGSCRGVLLLCCYFTDLYLWNPTTGLHKRLPRTPFAANSEFYLTNFYFGFGHNPITDDYLVVLVHDYHIELFSSTANRWRRVQGIHMPFDDRICGRYIGRRGCLLNGAIHWLPVRADRSVSVIVAFDIVERSFSMISLPNDFENPSNLCRIWVHGGLLSLCVLRAVGTACESTIWVMREYKLQSSWTKSIVLPSVGDIPIPTEKFSPVCSTESGDILGFDGNRGLVKFNAKGELQEHLPESEYRKDHLMEAAMYTESLLPLPGDIRQAAA